MFTKMGASSEFDSEIGRRPHYPGVALIPYRRVRLWFPLPPPPLGENPPLRGAGAKDLAIGAEGLAIGAEFLATGGAEYEW